MAVQAKYKGGDVGKKTKRRSDPSAGTNYNSLWETIHGEIQRGTRARLEPKWGGKPWISGGHMQGAAKG